MEISSEWLEKRASIEEEYDVSSGHFDLDGLLVDIVVTTPPDIQEALQDHRFWNDKPSKWATLHMEQFPHMRVVRLSIGDILCGQKYRANFHINYVLWNDGSVYKVHSPDL